LPDYRHIADYPNYYARAFLHNAKRSSTTYGLTIFNVPPGATVNFKIREYSGSVNIPPEAKSNDVFWVCVDLLIGISLIYLLK